MRVRVCVCVCVNRDSLEAKTSLWEEEKKKEAEVKHCVHVYACVVVVVHE